MLKYLYVCSAWDETELFVHLSIPIRYHRKRLLTLHVLFANVFLVHVALFIWGFFSFLFLMSVSTLMSPQLSGQFSQRLFRKLPPRVCVPLKNIVSEEFLRAGSVFMCVNTFVVIELVWFILTPF